MRFARWRLFNRGPIGHVDHINNRIIRGWAWHPARPRARLQLEFFCRGVYIGHTSAGVFRQDLLANAIGDGRHGFVFHLPEDLQGTDADLADLSVIVCDVHCLLDRSKAVPAARWPHDLESFFAPYLSTLRHRTDEDTPATTAGDRPKIDAICALAAETGMSAFATHIAHKYGRAALATADPTAFWAWYLETYAMERGPSRTPLSREDIERLMRLDLPSSSGSDADARYAWAAEESARLFVEDCLVTAPTADALREILPSDRGSSFPLSVFMRRLKGRHAIWRRLPVRSEADRKTFYVVCMMLGLRSPHYLAYMPRIGLSDMLAPKAGTSVFEEALGTAVGPISVISAARYRTLIAATGFDLETQSFAGTRYQGHRVLGGSQILTGSDPVDVQIIGPVRRKMGLGESCRRIVEALRLTPFSLNVVHYDIGNASSDIAMDDRLDRIRPARLNILHLNAEELPEAFAYLPDVFSGSQTVAIPYWELNRPAAAHRLGLRMIDRLWVASTYLRDVFETPDVPVTRIGMSADDTGMTTAAQTRALRDHYAMSPTTFVFLTTSDALSWVQRKNPFGVIQAFQQAFPGAEDVGLIVKTHNLDGPLSDPQRAVWAQVRALCAADPRIVLIAESLDVQSQRALLAGCDCLVSLHRAEGLGLDLLDAMAIGIPLVTTSYSGNMDFCAPDTAWLVDYDLRPVHHDEYGFVEPGHVWAEPHLDSAAAAMVAVHADPEARRARMAAGQAWATRDASPEALAARLSACIANMLGEAGGRRGA